MCFCFFFSEKCFFFCDTLTYLLQVVSILLKIGKPNHTKATLPNYKASHWRKKSRLWVGYSWDLQNQCLNCYELNCRFPFEGEWVGDFYFLRTASNSSLGAERKECIQNISVLWYNYCLCSGFWKSRGCNQNRGQIIRVNIKTITLALPSS